MHCHSTIQFRILINSKCFLGRVFNTVHTVFCLEVLYLLRKLPESEEIRILYEKYELSANDVIGFKEKGFTFRDMDKGGLYAYISGKPLGDILKLRKYDCWMMVEKKLNLTPNLIYEKTLRYRAECAKRWWGMDAEEVYDLMKEGYPRHSIKLAWILSNHSSMKTQDILREKNRTISWKAWAENRLGIKPSDFTEWITKYLNPSMPRKS